MTARLVTIGRARIKRVLRNLNKSKHLRTVGYVLLTLPILLPMTFVSAADNASVPSGHPVGNVSAPTLVALTANVVEVATPTVTFQVDPTSPYLQQVAAQAAAKAAEVKAQMTARVAAVQPSPDEATKLALAQQAASAYGIDWRVLAAVWQVESGQQWQTSERSGAGAQGPCQFLPSTWRHYAVDGNGDGVANIDDAQDCLYGAARLLAAAGASSGHTTLALLAYNHSMSYVDKVLRIAQSIS